MTIDDVMWDDLRAYYDLHGTGFLCCCPVEQYAQEVVFYDELDKATLEPLLKRFLAVAVRQALAKFKTSIEVYRMEVICNSRLHVPLLFNQAVCRFVISDRKIIVSDQITDFVNEGNDEKSCVEVYFWKSI